MHICSTFFRLVSILRLAGYPCDKQKVHSYHKPDALLVRPAESGSQPTEFLPKVLWSTSDWVAHPELVTVAWVQEIC